MNRVILNPLFLEYFKDYNYFKNIISTIKKIRLSEINESYLRLFVSNPHYSAYDIKQNKKMQDEKVHDKLNDNAYRRAKVILRKLAKLKLIALDKEKEKNPHNRKPYFLTDIGLFYIIKSPTLRFYIQDLIRNYPDFKIFKDLLYPFINLGTLCSENIPRDILNAISLYIQKLCSNIENFISFVKNKNNWNEISWNWNIEKLRKYLIDKYKYEWLENAEDKEDNEQTNLIFFNENKCSQSINIRLRFKGDKPYGYLISGTKKKKKEIPIPNIETF